MPFGIDEIAAIGAAISTIGGLFGGGGQGGPGLEPSDFFRRSKTTLPEAGIDEQELMNLILENARQAARIGSEGLPGGLTLEALASGELPLASQQRIHERAFAGVDEGLRRAGVQAGQAALSRGLGPASSFEATAFGELSRPLLSEAAGREASLQQAELQRLGGLRDRTISNMLALQDLPALNRLMQLRLIEGQRDELALTRFPGGLPPWAGRPELGLPPVTPPIERIPQEDDRFRGVDPDNPFGRIGGGSIEDIFRGRFGGIDPDNPFGRG